MANPHTLAALLTLALLSAAVPARAAEDAKASAQDKTETTDKAGKTDKTDKNDSTEKKKPSEVDGLPGSEIPPGPGLAPEAPPVAPAPGGLTPSFGTPTTPSTSTFRLGGRFFGWESVGIGRKPVPAPPGGSSGTPLHTPAVTTGKIPFWGGAGATLNAQYGTPSVTAFAMYYFRVNRPELQSYSNPGQGPSFGQAYLLFTPQPVGGLKLQIRLGGFIEPYAGPGQWGWGIFGPMLAVRGMGETTNGELDLTPDLRLTLTHGVLVVPGVPADYVRGDYASWFETGVSGYVNHAHLGLTYKNQYVLKLHYASDYATDERAPDASTILPGASPGDGRWDTYLAEARVQGDPWGQFGISGGVYDFHHAVAVTHGIMWAVDFSQGSREMIQKYLGSQSDGTGKVGVVGAEYNFSVSRILWAPRSFTGQAPDLRISIAAMLVRTLASQDARYEGKNAYFAGLDTEYRMTSMFSVTFQAYAENRFTDPDVGTDRWAVYSVNPGIAYHSNWLTTDRIQLIYSRRFYSDTADNNSAAPLDRHMIALGGYVTF